MANERTDKVLTVSELIKKLEQFDQNMPVLAEGCDCYGPAGDVEVSEWDGVPHVLITRIEGY